MRSQRRMRSIACMIDTIAGTTTKPPAPSAQTELAGRDIASTTSPYARPRSRISRLTRWYQTSRYTPSVTTDSPTTAAGDWTLTFGGMPTSDRTGAGGSRACRRDCGPPASTPSPPRARPPHLPSAPRCARRHLWGMGAPPRAVDRSYRAGAPRFGGKRRRTTDTVPPGARAGRDRLPQTFLTLPRIRMLGRTDPCWTRRSGRRSPATASKASSDAAGWASCTAPPTSSSTARSR